MQCASVWFDSLFFFIIIIYFRIAVDRFQLNVCGKWKRDTNRGKGIKANQVIWMVGVWYIVWLCICGVLAYGCRLPLYAELNCALHSQLTHTHMDRFDRTHDRRDMHSSLGLADKIGRAKSIWQTERQSWLISRTEIIYLAYISRLLPPSTTDAKLVRWLDSSLFAIFAFHEMEKFFSPPTSHANRRQRSRRSYERQRYASMHLNL